jgi:hypothetical protein
MTNLEKKWLKETIETQIKEEGFNEDGDCRVDLTDEMYSIEEITEVIESMGYNGEFTGVTGEWWISKK